MSDEVPSILKKIVAEKRIEVVNLRVNGDALKYKREAVKSDRDFVAAISRPKQQGLNLIAEFKKASPSAGEIRPGADPVTIGKLYEGAGASAISVLTEEIFFQGSLNYLQAIRNAVKLPVIMKDFIIDEMQIPMGRCHGADAFLLITTILDNYQLHDYRQQGEGLGMPALVEVHNESELERAISSGAKLLGINNRDLHKMKTDINTTRKLLEKIPKGYNVPIVTESGIYSYLDVVKLSQPGVKAMLVGESIMSIKDNPTEEDIQNKIYHLLGRHFERN